MTRRHSFDVRVAHTEDAGALAAMYARLYPVIEERTDDVEGVLTSLLDDTRSWFYVAADPEGGGPLGFMYATLQILPGRLGRQVTLEDVWVDPSVQGKGVGKALFDALHLRCRAEGDVELLQIRAPRGGSDQDPTQFYEKLGFEAIPMTIYRRPTHS